MTQIQVDVYRGRMMGCMACGRPFAVKAPEPPPEVDPLFAIAPPGEGEGRTESTPQPAPVVTSPNTVRAKPSFLDRAGVAAAVLCVMLVAAAACVGYTQASPTHVISSGPAVTLAQLAIVSAGVAVLLGVVAVLQAWRSRLPDAGVRRSVAPGWTAVSLGLTELVFAALLTLLTWTPMARALDQSNQAACQTRMEQLGSLLVMQAQSNAQGAYPASLNDLVTDGQLPASVLVCPQDGVTPYVYVGKGLAMKPGGGKRVSTHTVLMYETPGRHGSAGGIHLIFADGTVGFAEGEQATAILADLQAGKNPPPSTGAVRP